MDKLKIVIPAFAENDWIPLEYSARGIDISPEIRIENICEQGVSMAITMHDVSHPLFKNFNHWIIWNLPITNIIPSGIKKAKFITKLNGAVQGLAYGKHCYKGPKPPLKTVHTYSFIVYILDKKIKLSEKSEYRDFLIASKGHILQKATYSGKFQSRRK